MVPQLLRNRRKVELTLDSISHGMDENAIWYPFATRVVVNDGTTVVERRLSGIGTSRTNALAREPLQIESRP